MDERGMKAIAEMGLPDRAGDSDALPQVPQSERVWFKPLRSDLAKRALINPERPYSRQPHKRTKPLTKRPSTSHKRRVAQPWNSKAGSRHRDVRQAHATALT